MHNVFSKSMQQSYKKWKFRVHGASKFKGFFRKFSNLLNLTLYIDRSILPLKLKEKLIQNKRGISDGN